MGGPGGLAAALTAARQGAKVLLAERNGYLGGGLALGIPILGFLDSKRRKVASGIGEEIVDRLAAAGGSYGIKVDPHHNSLVTVHPDLFKIVAIDLCTEAGIEVVMHCETVDVDVTAYDGKQGIENLGNPKVVSEPTREILVKLYSAKGTEYANKGKVLSGLCAGVCHKVKKHLNPVCTADGKVVGVCNSPKCLEAHLTRVLPPK